MLLTYNNRMYGEFLVIEKTVSLARSVLTKLNVIDDLFYERQDVTRPQDFQFFEVARDGVDIFLWIGRHHLIIGLSRGEEKKYEVDRCDECSGDVS